MFESDCQGFGNVDVARWLQSLGLVDLVGAFEEQKIDGSVGKIPGCARFRLGAAHIPRHGGETDVMQ